MERGHLFKLDNRQEIPHRESIIENISSITSRAGTNTNETKFIGDIFGLVYNQFR